MDKQPIRAIFNGVCASGEGGAMSAYQPKTGAKCGCRRGVQRDNCPHCEGTGMMIDFKAIRACGGEDMNIQPKIDGAIAEFKREMKGRE